LPDSEYILGAVAALERDLICERVRNGLANAKAKGIRIGRLKTRDSDLIRKLKASGMTHRMVAHYAKCSQGAVSAELRAMKKEEKLKAEEEKAMSELLVLEKPDEEYSTLIQDNSEYGMLTVGNDKSDLKLELEL
jgi:DNA invertase Pin-like site-specific DNA recombinase